MNIYRCSAVLTLYKSNTRSHHCYNRTEGYGYMVERLILKRSNSTVFDAKIWKRPSKDESRPRRDF